MNRAQRIITGFASLLLMTLAACGTTPERIDELEQARATVQNLERQPMAQNLASPQLANARAALSRAETALENGAPLPEILHEAYVARVNAEIGLETIAEATALERIEQAEAERMRVQLEARTAAVERARMQAEAQGEEARQLRQEAEEARAAAQAASEENRRLQQQLSDLEAKQTERGVVLTLDDVLFETDEAELKPGASMAINRIADFLRDQPERRLLIEGHTDARGSEQYNERLSMQRAYAVAEALAERGIATNRLQPVGLGESYPVASNETTAGRQQNRRVEIVVSERDGSFEENAQRTPVASTRDR
ncbi:MAG TPA: OmpA family protein [Woeseiaceae bacterium]|nr:OmpA family protein [Woeseiaceae bacterium]